MKKPKIFRTRKQNEKDAEQLRLARELMASIKAELMQEDENNAPAV